MWSFNETGHNSRGFHGVNPTGLSIAGTGVPLKISGIFEISPLKNRHDLL
jgi:hypothetical protein